MQNTKLEKFEQHMKELFESEKYQEVYDFCIGEIEKIPKDTENIPLEEYGYIAKVYSTLARILEPQDALDFMDCAIDFVGNSPDYYIQRGQIKERLSDFQGAFDDYSIVIANAPCYEAYAFRGCLRESVSDYQGALEDLTKALELNPEYSGGYIECGRTKYALGKFQEAIEYYNKAIAKFPNYAFAYGVRGDAKIKLKDYEGALADFRKMMELEPENLIARRAFVDIKKILAGDAGIATMTCTKKDGTKVCQYMTDEGIIEIPINA